MAFHLLSASGGTVPFALGFVFREGDVPANATLSTDFAEFQVSRKSAWPDGSLKFAVLSGRASLQPNSLRTVTLRTGGTPVSGPAIGTAALKATGISASVSFGTYGTAAWNGSDWDAPAQSLVSGPEMSSWVYRKAIGSDAHLVAWLEVRCWVGGQIEVVPWIENGYLKVAAPAERGGMATFTLGGTQRFAQSLTLYNHTRAVLASGTTYSHWLGTDPQLSWRHDVAYMKASKLVPNYVSTSTTAFLDSLTTSYTPLAQADYSASMPGTGYARAIGLLPAWDAGYITSNGDLRAWRSVQVNGYCAGRYGFHFRDETTQRPLAYSSYPNLCMGGGNGVVDTGSSSTSSYTPAASGGSPPVMDTAHLPAIAYMAALVTGRHYFVEELQFLSTAHFLKQTDTVRNYSQYLIQPSSGANQPRGAAWAFRSLAQTAVVTADDDVLAAQFKAAVQHNIDWYHSRYASNGNPCGHVEGYGNTAAYPGYTNRCWMDDFITMAWGFARDTKTYGSDRTIKIDAFLAYKYRAIVGRLGPGTAGTYNFEYAAQYDVAMSPATNPDWAGGTGPWYADWGAVATAMSVPANGGTSTLRGTSGSSPSEMATGYWGNLHPAIAYAVDHGAAGASAAWARLTAATNYASSSAGFDSTPEWGIVPRR